MTIDFTSSFFGDEQLFVAILVLCPADAGRGTHYRIPPEPVFRHLLVLEELLLCQPMFCFLYPSYYEFYELYSSCGKLFS